MLFLEFLIWVFWSQNVGPDWVKNGKVAKGMHAIFQRKGKRGQKKCEKIIWKLQQKFTKFEIVLKKGRWLCAVTACNELLERPLINLVFPNNKVPYFPNTLRKLKYEPIDLNKMQQKNHSARNQLLATAKRNLPSQSLTMIYTWKLWGQTSVKIKSTC